MSAIGRAFTVMFLCISVAVSGVATVVYFTHPTAAVQTDGI